MFEDEVGMLGVVDSLEFLPGRVLWMTKDLNPDLVLAVETGLT
jgi:hypothetical protein